MVICSEDFEQKRVKDEYHEQVARPTKREKMRRQSQVCLVKSLCDSRDTSRIACAGLVVARLRVRLAIGETNEVPRITLCVIHTNMGEHSLSTQVQDVCRAFGKLFEMAMTPALPSSQMDLVPQFLKNR